MNNKLVKVIIEPDGIEAHVPAGTLFSKVAAASGIPIESPCGGMGTCGKCKVTVSGNVSEPDAAEVRSLSDTEIADGVRLACRTHIDGDATVTVPEASRSLVQKILSHGMMRNCEIASGIKKTHVKLAPPTLEDERAALERIEASVGDLNASLNVLHNLSSKLEFADYDVTVVTSSNDLISVEPGDTTAHCYGIAYDLGSTTIVGYLMDLSSGKELGVSSVMNPQMVYGDDLVSRISFASTHDNGIGILQESAVSAMNRIAEELCSNVQVSAENIYKATVVGNTCMTHILLGIDVASLGQSPYEPTVCKNVQVQASKLGLMFCPEAIVHVLPNVAGFVGSDLVAVMLSAQWEQDGRTRLAVDIGTNGEMALMHKGRTYVCSAAAGPAFEGAGISCGMRGAPGAVDAVTIGDDVKLSVIDGRRPIGICGSGLLDAAAQMLDAGIIDETGKMLSPGDADFLHVALRERLVTGESGVEFVLATKQESGNGKPISITAKDIRCLQLAKGSIHAAIQTMIKEAGATDDDLSEILLAGAFGNYIGVGSAIRIGLIPAIDINKVNSIGNAAGVGAKLALLSEVEMEIARQLASSAKHIELAASSDYQNELMERMLFPPKP